MKIKNAINIDPKCKGGGGGGKKRKTCVNKLCQRNHQQLPLYTNNLREHISS